MARNNLSYFLALTCYLCLSCSAEVDTATIGQQYLNSKEFRQFNKQANQEQLQSVKENRSLLQRLSTLGHCDHSNTSDPPFSLAASTIGERDLSAQGMSSGEGYELNLIACLSFREIEAQWIVLTNSSIYLDKELLLATIHRNRLVDYRVVGIYRQNLSEDISTHVGVKRTPDHIVILSSMDRAIQYPFEQNNSIQAEYHVDSKGSIELAE
ncbi:hypothetical protein [Fodinibius salsisoli]|uniref:Uncharacterized protein n=1 Tax=Fodinibius salsisoli TaxID=2820877 RepID=A0ABT3PMJ8_9BACT|nr:hypothetical protein [Fodinibius salsisoli]MCW9707162.1 hypothetical protein [Fodinibius salsisoli]